MGLSIALAIHNEAVHLSQCLATTTFADEVVVLLDRCTDQSKTLAMQAGCQLIEGAWPKEGERRNALLKACSHDWIFELDADERIPPALQAELATLASHPATQAHMVRLDNYIGQRLVRHGWGPTCFGIPAKCSLFPKASKVYDTETLDAHVPYQLQCTMGPTLKHAIIHYREKNISEVLRRLDHYTTLRARQWQHAPHMRGKARSHTRRFFTYFYKSYIRRKGYREGVYGVLIALCAALYFPLAYIKSQSDEIFSPETTKQ